jgi:hypothetical protein
MDILTFVHFAEDNAERLWNIGFCGAGDCGTSEHRIIEGRTYNWNMIREQKITAPATLRQCRQEQGKSSVLNWASKFS